VKDYVYLPLALHYLRLERGIGNEYKPHIYAMVLMGLWHGAAWTYVLWGLYHGIMLVVWDVLKWPKRFKGLRKRVPAAFWIVVYFHVTLGSLFIFRAKSVGQVGDYIATIFARFGGLELHLARPPLPTLVGIPIFLVLDYLAYRADTERFFERWWPAARGGLYAMLVVLLIMGWSNAAAEFIYLQF
jgi:hypothetical protein